MLENSQPITNAVVQSVSPGAKLKAGGQVPRKTIDTHGRILNVRSGRKHPRRYSPMPFGGTNRRQPRIQRRATAVTDSAADRVVTLLVPAGAIFDQMVGKEVQLKILS